MKHRILVAMLGASSLAACSEDAGTGTVAIAAWGESFIEEGITADVVADGWALAYDKFDVTLSDISIAGVTLAGPVTVDLTKASGGKGQSLKSQVVDAGDHDGGAFTVTKVEVAATASKGDVTKTFDWVFNKTTRYTECEAVVSVPKNGTGSFVVTIHADHLLYDSIVAEEPAVGFGAYAAADKDGNGVITQAELEATDIGAFDPGNYPVKNLWQFVDALVGTLGHANGEGHCKAQ